MDDSPFDRFGYDPVRIFTHIHGTPPAAGGIAQLGKPRAGEAPANPPPEEASPVLPQPVPAEAGTEVAAAPAADGGGSLADAASAEGLLHDPLDGATPGSGEEPQPAESTDTGVELAPEPHQLVVAWMNEHWDIIETMARAGDAPQRPAPPPEPEPEPSVAQPRPYVAPGDRWNKPKMAEFLRQLAATHSVTAAARAVGLSRRSAYKLRARLKGQPFDIAWEAAFRHGYDELSHAALELALSGEEVPHYHQGELKGTHRKRHPQLMVQLLKMRNRDGAPTLGRYGAAAEYWSENWDKLTHRVETGSVTWDDEHRAMSDEERAALDLPDENKKLDQIIVRNLTDDPKGRRGG